MALRLKAALHCRFLQLLLDLFKIDLLISHRLKRVFHQFTETSFKEKYLSTCCIVFFLGTCVPQRYEIYFFCKLQNVYYLCSPLRDNWNLLKRRICFAWNMVSPILFKKYFVANFEIQNVYQKHRKGAKLP